ncbi:hypothetical protein CPB86DRAFT_486566 [Serendipita vermifera]|nr:hypothetical protein CPB86DRAFT_486566 [Serendipita vermifera]
MLASKSTIGLVPIVDQEVHMGCRCHPKHPEYDHHQQAQQDSDEQRYPRLLFCP